MEICPRCKKKVLDRTDCGESGVYNSRHLICVPCFHEEFKELEDTNDRPDLLKAYGPSNDPEY